MIEVGQTFPDIQTYSEEGVEVRLPERTKGSYTVLVRGCLTCPVFWRSYHDTEAVSHDYTTKGVKFFFVYGSLAHPENNGYIQPFSLEERLMHVAEAKKTMQTTIPWLADNMENQLKWALGNMPNAECVLDPEGKVVYARSWSDSEQLRETLEELVGPVENPTQAADLGLPTIRRQRPTDEALPRVEVSEQLVPVKVDPQLGDNPFYAKLRVEVEPSVLESGDGQIYLGFHLDPLYQTHWNHLAEPLRFEITGPSEASLSPANGVAPKVEQETDSGPREFLIEVAGLTSETRLGVRVRYFACSEEPAFCEAITQDYEIQIERDPLAGGVSGRSFRPGGRRGRSRRSSR